MKLWKLLMLAAALAGALVAQTAPESDALKDARYRLGLTATRAVANFEAADSIEANLKTHGSTLNPQIVTLKLRIQAALNDAHKALDKGELKQTNDAIKRADSMLDKFADKIGGLKAMRLAWMALALACFTAGAQTASSTSQSESANPAWRSTLMGWPERAGAGTSIQEINRFIENVQLAAPYFATLSPGDYEANRELVRRLWAYMSTLELMARDPQMRLAVGRARGAMNAIRFGFSPGVIVPGSGPVPQAPPPPAAAPSEPPFAKAPSDVEVPDELRTRYDLALGRADTAWYSIEALRQSLAARGYTLNAQTAAAMGRIQLDFDMASRNVKGHDWKQVGTYLERAEYETAKVLKTVGQ